MISDLRHRRQLQAADARGRRKRVPIAVQMLFVTAVAGAMLWGYWSPPLLLRKPPLTIEIEEQSRSITELQALQSKIVQESLDQWRASYTESIVGITQVAGIIGALFVVFQTGKAYQVSQNSNRVEGFARAFEQLTSSDESRLFGIHSLEQLARSSEEDYWAVMEALTLYLRNQHRSVAAQQQNLPGLDPPPLSKDKQAVLRVIRRRKWHYHFGEREDQFLDLSHLALAGGKLTKAHLEAADLRGANLYRANLRSAHLDGARIDQSTVLEGADLEGAFLESMDLSMCNLSQANFSDAHLKDAKFVGMGWEMLDGTSFFGADVRRTDFTDSDLSHTNGFTEVQLGKARTTGATLPLFAKS